MSSSPADRYLARLRAVLEFIDTHLDEPLDVERLSAVAAFSKCHFHRQFAETFGIGVYKYVQLSRLKRASYRLAFRDDASVLEIAHESGYEGPEAFARAYKKALGQTPSDFRKQPQWSSWHATYDSLNALRSTHMASQFRFEDVVTIDFPETKVATLEHRGDPQLLGDSIRRFIEWRKHAGLHPRSSATYNILYDDPTTIAPSEFRFDLCAATDRDVSSPDHGIIMKTLPKGRCARLRVTGGDETMARGIRFLYSQWLPNSSSELRDFPLFLQRVRFFPDVPEHEQVIDIFLPLAN